MMNISLAITKKIFTMLLFSWIFLGANVPTATAMDKGNYQAFWQASFSYYCAARVCGNSDTIETAKNTLVRVTNYGDFHNLLSNAAVDFQKRPAIYIERGENLYRRQKWVSCDQVKKYVVELDNASKQLP